MSVMMLICWHTHRRLAIEDGDEESVALWVQGFGNCVEDDNDVASFIYAIDFSFRDELLEVFLNFIGQYFDIDVFDEEGPFRSADSGVDWDAVAEEITGLM